MFRLLVPNVDQSMNATASLELTLTTPENQQTVMKRFFEEHGMEVVGPPLKF